MEPSLHDGSALMEDRSAREGAPATAQTAAGSTEGGGPGETSSAIDKRRRALLYLHVCGVLMTALPRCHAPSNLYVSMVPTK